MEIIKKLSEMIEEEIEDAEKYALCAIKHKDSDQMLSKLFYTLAEEEQSHVKRLHEAVVSEINKYKATGEAVPEGMQAVYDYLHEKHIKDVANIENIMAMYRK